MSSTGLLLEQAVLESKLMSAQLPSELAAGATLRDQEYGWTVDSFPAAVRAAERLEIACLGGQFQFRVGDAVYEPYWVCADSVERQPGEGWSNYTYRSCGEVGQAFERLVRMTDFRAVAREWQELRGATEAGLDVMCTLVFVAYFVTEQEYDSLSHAKE
jgi:hypothetical protein